MRLSAKVCVLVLLVASACADEPKRSAVGAGPRFPDDEGVVTDVNFDRVVIDGKRSHRITEAVESFSTYDGSVMPLLHHKGRYVQLGLTGNDEVEWIAGIGLVVDVPPKTVIYNGTVAKIESKRRVSFEDGTVLTLSGRVTLPEPGQRVKATIDPVKHQVVEIAIQ